MSVLVFYGGTGINIISYCCTECRSAGINVLINNKCCDIHNHRHDDACTHPVTSGWHTHTGNGHEADYPSHTIHAGSNYGDLHATNRNDDLHDYSNYGDLHSAGTFCSLERIQFDWDSYHLSNLTKNLFSESIHLFTCNLLHALSLDFISSGENHLPVTHGPPIALPRDYLSILTVLLI